MTKSNRQSIRCVLGTKSGLNDYLLAVIELMGRDETRLMAAFKTVNRCPLGAIARKAMKIAAEICVYTNENLTVETIEDAAA